MSRWRFFTDEESVGMDEEVCRKRDLARQYFGAPIEQTCGYRDPVHNSEIGGVPNSAHTKGLAWDMKAPTDPVMREKLMWALGLAGFVRVESAPHHFHADSDETKPYPCFFQGEDK